MLLPSQLVKESRHASKSSVDPVCRAADQVIGGANSENTGSRVTATRPAEPVCRTITISSADVIASVNHRTAHAPYSQRRRTVVLWQDNRELVVTLRYGFPDNSRWAKGWKVGADGLCALAVISRGVRSAVVSARAVVSNS